MDIIPLWIIRNNLFLLLSTGCIHCVYRDNKKNWTDAFQDCQLTTKSEAYQHVERHRSWVGALQLNTPWMVHEGCFHLAKTFLEQRYIERHSPAECSYHCRHYVYFALKGTQCMCDHNIIGAEKVQLSLCSTECHSSSMDMCGSNIFDYANIYMQVTGNDVPLGNMDADYSCSIFRVTNRAVHLYSSTCWKKRLVLCHHHKSANGRLDYNWVTFNSAQRYCTLRTKLDIDSVHRLQLRGGEYWSGIHRRKIIKWLETESMSDMCDVIDSFDNIRCIVIDWKSRNSISEVPMLCGDLVPVLCSNRQSNVAYHRHTIKNCTKETAIATKDSSSINNRQLRTNPATPMTTLTESDMTVDMDDTSFARVTEFDHVDNFDRYTDSTTKSAIFEKQNGKVNDNSESMILEKQEETVLASTEWYLIKKRKKKMPDSSEFTIIENQNKKKHASTESASSVEQHTQIQDYKCSYASCNESTTRGGIDMPTEQTTVSFNHIGQTNIHLMILISVVGLSLFCIGITGISLCIAYSKKRKCKSSAILQDNFYHDLLKRDYDQLQIQMTLPNKLYDDAQEEECQYVEIT